MYDVPTVAAQLGVSRQTVVRLILGGKLAAVNVGTRTRHYWRVHPDAVRVFMGQA